jgi:hypothetical protein
MSYHYDDYDQWSNDVENQMDHEDAEGNIPDR